MLMLSINDHALEEDDGDDNIMIGEMVVDGNYWHCAGVRTHKPSLLRV